MDYECLVLSNKNIIARLKSMEKDISFKEQEYIEKDQKYEQGKEASVQIVIQVLHTRIHTHNH